MSATTSKLDILLHGWDHAVEKEGWYPPLSHALSGVTAEQAAWQPQGEAFNTIWGIVNHLIFCRTSFLKSLRGEAVEYPASNDETFVPGQSDDDWANTVAKLVELHGEIRLLLSKMSDAELENSSISAPLGEYTYSQLVHDAYHTGQIITLRKLQGSWPASRSFG